NYAALACTDFPLCNGALLPQMDFHNGFTIWRDLGMTAHGEYITFAALTAIHWMHRAFAFVVAALLVWLALRAYKIATLRKTARWLLITVVLQFSIGIATVLLQLPLLLAVAHNGGAALLLMLLVMLHNKTRTAKDQDTAADS
ncbi:MAG: COX15/CtaA family protein, partial [Gallionella sp.]|nr:COX15/CtaA family protein [Gallionella sp.]